MILLCIKYLNVIFNVFITCSNENTLLITCPTRRSIVREVFCSTGNQTYFKTNTRYFWCNIPIITDCVNTIQIYSHVRQAKDI